MDYDIERAKRESAEITAEPCFYHAIMLETCGRRLPDNRVLINNHTWCLNCGLHWLSAYRPLDFTWNDLKNMEIPPWRTDWPRLSTKESDE